MTVAALFAYLGTAWLGLVEGYWAVITCLVVVQGTVGGTLDAAVSRINGTVAGAMTNTGIERHSRTAPIKPELGVMPLSDSEEHNSTR
jgi:hypothetical protein